MSDRTPNDDVQALHDALTPEAKAAVDALPDDWFADERGNEAARVLAESIQLAHEHGPNMWSIIVSAPQVRRWFVCLNVGNTNLVSFDAGVLKVVLDPGDLPEAWAEPPLSDRFGRSYESGGHRQITVSDLDDAHSTEALKANQSMIVGQSTGGWTNNARAKWHRDDWRVKLAVLTGSRIPAPQYVSVERSGLDQALFNTEEVEGNSTKPSSVATQRFWKISAGRRSTEWPMFRDGSIAAMSWYDEVVDPTNFPDERDAFIQRLTRETSVTRPGAESVWNFRNEVGVGDAVLVYARYEVLGYGAVTGDYWYESDLPDYRHQRAVEWEPFESVDTRGIDRVLQQKLSRPATLIELTADEFAEATGQWVTTPHDIETPITRTSSDVRDAIHGSFAAVGLTYTNTQIASYYTALQTKGFVILSGISGTGKSRIASRFAGLLPSPSPVAGTVSLDTDVAEPLTGGWYRLVVRDYMGKFQRFAIPAETASTLPLPEPGTAFNVPLTVNGEGGEARIRVRTTGSATLFPKGTTRAEFVAMTRSTNVFYLRFTTSKSGDLIDSVEITSEGPSSRPSITVRVTEASIRYRAFGLPWSQAQEFPFPDLGSAVRIPVRLPNQMVEGRLENPNKSPGGNGIQVDLTVEAQPFVNQLVAGDELTVYPTVKDGTVAELEIAKRIPSDHGTVETDGAGSNLLFLPVRPDWRDGKALIGYHNPLTGEYVRTPFLDFVIAAADDRRAGNHNAFFVLLDEMNLAHVEYYFADVLSVIESGRDADGFTVEGIPLNAGEADPDLPDRLHLPPNLYLVGTVNMDETTHPFSAKVLDRAFTIELTEVDFTGYPPPDLDDDGEGEGSEAVPGLLEAFTRNGAYPRIDKSEIAGCVGRHPNLRDDLQALNVALKRHRLHFGYRVFDEIVQFVANAEHNGLFTVPEAFDHAVLMKVLPKFNGSRARLETALLELLHWSRTAGTPGPASLQDLRAQAENLKDGQPYSALVKADSTPTDAVEGETGDSVDDWRFPATGRRAASMLQDLHTDGFAAFG